MRKGFQIKKFIKRTIAGILIVLVFVCIIQYTKETVLGNPKRILDNISPRLKHLTNLSIAEKVYNADRPITYSLSYMNIFPIGKAYFSAQKRKNHILLKATAKVSNFINSIYPVEAGVWSRIDKEKFYPYQYVEVTKIPEKEKKKEIIFYPNKNMAERDGKKYKIPPMTFCPLSAFYYLQMQDFSLGKTYKIKLLSKEEIYVLEVKVVEEEGDIVALRGQVRREDLSSTHGASFEFFVSKEFRVPLLIKIKTHSGTIVARAI